jgi:hypothetical protein
LRFERNDANAFVGFVDSPDQGIRGMPITEIAADGDHLRLRIPALRGEYTATLAEGRIEGTLKQGVQERPLTLEPGTYEPTRTPLELSAAAQQQLAGAWRGRLGPVDIVIRFEAGDDGAYFGSFNAPAQGVSGLSLSSASLEGTELTFAIAPLRVEYAATLAGNELSGRWQQGPGNVVPLTLTRD